MKKINSILKSCVLGLLTILFLITNNSIVARATETDDKAISGAGAAVLEIASYSVDGGVIEAGKTVTVNFVIHNTSSSAGASNVLMTISSTSSMAYPVYGSDNQSFVGSVSAGATAEVSIPVTISSKYSGDVLDLTCKLDYETKGIKASNSSNIVIPSSAGNTLWVKSIEVSKRAVVNGDSLVSVSYANVGTEDISGAELVLEGAVSADSERISLGTINSGKTYTEDFHISFIEMGDQQISVKLVYPVSEEEVSETNLGTYSVTVSAPVTTEVVDESTQAMLSLIGLAVAAAAFIAAVVVIIMYIKKR